MNIQIFGTKKCNDTKKAERFFKERGIKFQFIDMKEKGMSKGEFNSVAQANGGLENMVNWDGKDKDLLALIKYTADEDTRTVWQKHSLRVLVRALLVDYPGCKVCGHRDLSPDLNGNGEIEPEEWVKQCPCFDVSKEKYSK